MAGTTDTIPRSISLWRRLLVAPLPVLGDFGRRIAIGRLKAALRRGDSRAVQPLVDGLRSTPDEPIHTQILDALSKAAQPTCRAALWEAWTRWRSPQLETILLEAQQEAAFSSAAWALSLAKLGRIDALRQALPGKIAQLVALLDDPDEQVAKHARLALGQLQRNDSQNEVYRVWAETRSLELWQLARQAGYIPSSPLPVRVVYLLNLPDLEDLSHCDAEAVPFLCETMHDADPAIAQRARQVLPRLQNQAAIDQLCQLWQSNRLKALGDVIHEGRLVATRPIELRLLSALKAGRLDLARQLPAEAISVLCSLTSDPDPEVVEAARTALVSLQKPAAQSALCLFAVEQNHPLAFKLALQAGYLPQKPEQRALFLFLASQWRDYDAFDFDCRLMRANFEASPAELRQRIARQVQRSGNTAYLTILAGIDYRSNAAQLNPDEVSLLVELLIQNKEWPRLWSLVHILSFSWSIHILKTLAGAGWLPEETADQAECAELVRMTTGIDIPDRNKWLLKLPPAISVARVRVSGRVNDLCFSPCQPLIAIGTSTRKLALWNFRTASLERVRQGFNHSIARVAFVGEQFLTCGVRSNKDAACMIYGWQNDQAFVLPGHRGAVTALLPVGQSTLVSTGRDGAVIHWDLSARQELTRRTIADWPRAAVASPSQQVIALLSDSIFLYRLPNLVDISPDTVRTATNTGTRRSVAQCAVIPSDASELLVGQHNGQVVLYRQNKSGTGAVRKAVLHHRTAFAGLDYIPARRLLVSAMRNGRIMFHHWPDLESFGSLPSGSNRLTSLHVSPDGAFMATGSDASTMQLWDLRPQTLPDLIDLPLSQATTEHLSAVNSLLRSTALDTEIKQPLELLKALLLRRFRYDIQVDDLPQIQPGEFDILLD